MATAIINLKGTDGCSKFIFFKRVRTGANNRRINSMSEENLWAFLTVCRRRPGAGCATLASSTVEKRSV